MFSARACKPSSVWFRLPETRKQFIWAKRRRLARAALMKVALHARPCIRVRVWPFHPRRYRRGSSIAGCPSLSVGASLLAPLAPARAHDRGYLLPARSLRPGECSDFPPPAFRPRAAFRHAGIILTRFAGLWQYPFPAYSRPGVRAHRRNRRSDRRIADNSTAARRARSSR